MSIEQRIKKLEMISSANGSEFCTCGHKNKVRMETIKSDRKVGVIDFILLPCERCHKPIQKDFPSTITFTINPSKQIVVGHVKSYVNGNGRM